MRVSGSAAGGHQCHDGAGTGNKRSALVFRHRGEMDVSAPSTSEKSIFFCNVCKEPKFAFNRVLKFSSVEIRRDE